MTKGLLCEYEVANEGISRIKELRNRLEQRNQELELLQRDLEIKTNVLWKLQIACDEEAIEILSRLRVGHSLEDIRATSVEEVRVL